MTFTVLVVCSANVCRSPLIRLLLARRLSANPEPESSSVRLVSAGHLADPGRPACPDTVRWAASRSLPVAALSRYRSRVLDRAVLDEADLVLTADRRGRSAVVRLSPPAADRTFTVREAALLAAQLPARSPSTRAPRLHDLAAELNGARGLTDLPEVRTLRTLTAPWQRVQLHAHDVPDAHQDVSVSHRLVRRLLVPAVEDVSALLAGGPALTR